MNCKMATKKIRLIKLGSDDMPATMDDIKKVQKMAAQTRVTHRLPKKINGTYGELDVKQTWIDMPSHGTLLVEIGTDWRPASTKDLKEIEVQLSKNIDDKNLCIVTHYGFWAKWLQTAKQGLPFIVAKHKPNDY